jgi:hypothetical protein
MNKGDSEVESVPAFAMLYMPLQWVAAPRPSIVRRHRKHAPVEADMAIPGISAQLNAVITHGQEVNFQHYLDVATSTPSLPPPPSSAPTSSSSVASSAQSAVNQLNNLQTISQAYQDLIAEHQPIPKHLSVSQAQQIIKDFTQFQTQQQADSNIAVATGPRAE